MLEENNSTKRDNTGPSLGWFLGMAALWGPPLGLNIYENIRQSNSMEHFYTTIPGAKTFMRYEIKNEDFDKKELEKLLSG